jgi:dihydrofolate reductase
MRTDRAGDALLEHEVVRVVEQRVACGAIRSLAAPKPATRRRPRSAAAAEQRPVPILPLLNTPRNVTLARSNSSATVVDDAHERCRPRHRLPLGTIAAVTRPPKPDPAKETEMAARIVVTEFVSLDGVMEAPGGEPDFRYPGWTFQFDRGDDGNQFKLDETRQSDALLIGRRTYESFAGAWPQREGEFADKFNSMPKFVVSTTLKDPEWSNTTVLDSGDATAEVRKLKEEFDGELQVPGSHRLVQELIESDLVDQINLMVFPVILGTGKRAFEETAERRNLRLKESKVVGDGVVVLIYERAA